MPSLIETVLAVTLGIVAAVVVGWTFSPEESE